MSGYSRRSLLGVFACAGLALGAPSADAAERRLRALLPDPASVRPIGRLYLAHVPAERRELADRVLQDLGLSREQLLRLGDRELRRAVRTRVRQDYAAERTVMVAGWILSRTEARLSALCV
jgi:hypothetical protein